ncbi:tetraspanin-8 [Erinaceus europaeus]|uniref:Tetraspanin n=1 Tax=Erinaceus europaeus TaxID=9365 RepID=A0ABM3XKT8_ERIEU|nr:tetraspanin-8 [Erinaceus europaeus]
MAGVSTWIKHFMFIFNFLFWLCGVLVLSVTTWLIRDKNIKEILSLENTAQPYNAMNILVAVSAVIIILGFLGCCGAISESRLALLGFFIGMLVLLILQVIAGTVGIISKHKVEHILNNTFSETIQLLNSTAEAAKIFQEALIAFQKKFKCCGLINGAADWGHNFENISTSCECTATTAYSCTIYDRKHVYSQTCISLIKEEIKEHINTVIGIAFGLALIEVFGLLFSLILFFQIGAK